METIYTDCAVVGSGLAGLAFAQKMAEAYPDSNITLLTKEDLPESNSRYAQGGIAAVSDLQNDHFSLHIEDTLEAGHKISNPGIVEKVVKSAPHVIEDLERWGVRFDYTEKGQKDLGKEGGHSRNRILHFKDSTGKVIIERLADQVSNQSNITVLPYHFAFKLMVNQAANACQGIGVLDEANDTSYLIDAPITYLATGGSGQVYTHTTNPALATGDGIGLASEAGASLQHMAYFQFHPTTLHDPSKAQRLLITEAIRGSGALLRNQQGSRFMPYYDERAELAPRDVVARSIDLEMDATQSAYVFLDATEIDSDKLKQSFPNVYHHCLDLGLKMENDWIPVVPAAHYQCGGIAVDEQGKTDIAGLYAGGECACTGLHGANRLASNSLLEAVAFAEFSCEDIQHQSFLCNIESDYQPKNHSLPVASNTVDQEWILATKDALCNLMQDYAAIRRYKTTLETALQKTVEWKQQWDSFQTNGYIPNKDFQEVGNLIITAKSIIASSLEQHYYESAKAEQDSKPYKLFQ